MPLNSKNMKKQAASNYIAPGRQNMPVDRAKNNCAPRPDTAVRVVPQEFTTAQKNQAKANIGAAELIEYVEYLVKEAVGNLNKE